MRCTINMVRCRPPRRNSDRCEHMTPLMALPPRSVQVSRQFAFGMKNPERIFPSLPARDERGESWREGELMKNGLLSPTLSSFFGEEREKQTTCRTVLASRLT